MSRLPRPQQAPTSQHDPQKRQLQRQLLAIALTATGGLLGCLDLQPLVSGTLLLAGLATLLLPPRV